MLLRTIRSRLIGGFGASIGLLVAAGLLGWYGLVTSNRQADRTVQRLAERSDFTERSTATILRELIAGLRYLNSGTEPDHVQYLALVDQADQLRRDAIRQQILGPDERRRLENLGQLQATLEVRIAMTHAWKRAALACVAVDRTVSAQFSTSNNRAGGSGVQPPQRGAHQMSCSKTA